VDRMAAVLILQSWLEAHPRRIQSKRSDGIS
jgi:RNase H-fold protein (predicted Holliday junction resolvase)